MTPEQIAELVYGMSAVHASIAGRQETSDSLWNSDPPERKQFVIDSVRFYLDNPEAGPEAIHERWLENAPPFNEYAVPFNELPEYRQAQNRLFKAVVGALAPFVSAKA